MTDTNPPICPNCKQIDRVEKVTSIVSAGSTYLSYTVPNPNPIQIGRTKLYSDIQKGAVSISGTARKLLPPPEPAKPERPKSVNYQFTSRDKHRGARIFSTVIIALCAVALAYLVGKSIGGSDGLVTAFVVFCFSFLFVFPFVVSAFASWIPGLEATLKYDEEVKSIPEMEYQRLLEKHDRDCRNMNERWERSFYCKRCDGIFIPTNTSQARFIPIDQFGAFLLEGFH